MITNVKIKDPQAVLDYKWDFKPLTHGVEGAASDYLAAAETITAATVTAPTGLTVDSYSVTDTGTSVTAWISGGTVDTDYSVVCHITSSVTPRVDDRTLIVQVRQR
jgi:hypothetical protein